MPPTPTDPAPAAAPDGAPPPEARPPVDEARTAAFQQWFSDSIPHNRALGLAVLGVGRGWGRMRLDWRADLVGNPATGVLHGGAITAMLDACCGMAVASAMERASPFATLDLRIDYVRPATPHLPVIAEAECYRLTRNVAFTRAFAHQGDPKDPVAAAAGTFMMGTKGRPTAAHGAGRDAPS